MSAVVRLIAPAADEASLMRLIGFAQASDDYLAGIERLICRATFFAAREGRDVATRAEIKRAFDEAMPRMQPAPAPPIKAKKAASSARATAPQSQRSSLSAVTPNASAKRPELDLSAHDTGEVMVQFDLQIAQRQRRKS